MPEVFDRRTALASALGVLGLSLGGLFFGLRAMFGSDPVELVQTSIKGVQRRIIEGRGFPVVLYLYASWCPGCRASMGNVNQAVRRFHDRGVTFVVVSVDEEAELLEELLNITGAEFEPLIAPAAPKPKLLAMTRELGAEYPEVIPWGVVFDGDGKPIFEWTGGKSMVGWEGALEEALG